MLRFLMIAGLLSGLFSTQADARTIRYEFDVVDSWFSVGNLTEISSPFTSNVTERQVEYNDPLYQEVVAGIHPLADLIGKTGRVAMQLEIGWSDIYSIDCLSGILCAEFNRMHPQPGSVVDSAVNPNGFTIFAWGSSGEWYLGSNPMTGEGRLFFTDDRTWGTGWLNGNFYEHGGATADFALANFTSTEISPVPLPAAAPLLAMGLMAFGFVRRRARRLS